MLNGQRTLKPHKLKWARVCRKPFNRVGINLLNHNYMNKKIIFGAGAFVLAIGAFVAGRANAKFSTPSIYYTDGSGTSCKQIAAAGSNFTTGTSFVGNINFVTTGGTAVTLYTNANCSTALPTSHQVALKP